MTNTIIQYVVPAVIGAIMASLIGVIPYFFVRKSTYKEVQEGEKTAVETSKVLYESLAQRVEQLEHENLDLRKQLDIMKRKQNYIADLESSKHELESQVSELNSRIETLERSLSIVLSSVRSYVTFPDGGTQQLTELINSLEKQLKIN
jgi:signal transduction histidine kinase